MRPSPAALALTLSISTVAQAQIRIDPTCGPRIANLERSKNRAKPLEKVLTEAIKPQTKVIIFGEDHDLYGAKSALANLYKLIKKAHPRLNCVFIEQGVDHQPLLERFLAGEMDREAFTMAKMVANANGKVPDANYVKLFNDRMRAWDDLALAAHADGASVIHDDFPARMTWDYYQRGISDTEPRNFHMAQVMEESFRTGRCDLAIKVVGYAHVMSPTAGSGRKEAGKLQEILRAKGLPTIATIYSDNKYDQMTPFFYLDYKYDTYIPYTTEDEGDFDPADPKHEEPRRIFDAYEKECLEKALPLIPTTSVAVRAFSELLPAYTPAGVVNPKGQGRSAMMDQVDFWLWIDKSLQTRP